MRWRTILLLLCLGIQGLGLGGCAGFRKARKVDEPLAVSLETRFFAQAIEYERQGQMQKALESYEAALAVLMAKKKNLEVSLRTTAEKHYVKGLEFQGQGKYTKARHEFLVALRLWPDYPEVVELLQPAQRLRYTKYLVHEVQQGEFLTGIAQEYYQDQSKFDLIARFNNLGDATMLHAGMKLKIPEIEGMSFKHPKTKRPSKSPSRKERIIEVVRKSEDKAVEERAGKPTRASEQIGTASQSQAGSDQLDGMGLPEATSLEMDYDPVGVYQEQGISLFEAGQYMAALHEFQKVLNSDPARKRVRDYMARAHYRQGDLLFRKREYLKARHHFKEALTIDQQCGDCNEYLKRCEDTYKEIHYLKGIRRFEEEKLEQAIAEWQLVEELDPNYKQVQDYVRRAQNLKEKILLLKDKGETAAPATVQIAP
ncbi:MAG: tetratricopeptide repeat protein [Deltaproteobacteria bacterium]|nr:MAG: tetratricopeptide repeat protein [Deltaproteobacteria bacterium]